MSREIQLKNQRGSNLKAGVPFGGEDGERVVVGERQ